MIFLKLKSVLLLALAAGVHGHGVESRHCITAEGNLRIFVAHWHGALRGVSQPGTMRIQANHEENRPIYTLSPDGVINNVQPPASGLPGCSLGAVPTLDTTCNRPQNDDWVWYDFEGATCNTPVSYTVLAGNTFYLTEGCSWLYPATISETFTDQAPPAIRINGSPCVNGQGQTVQAFTDCGNQEDIVNFSISAADDCDANPEIELDPPGPLFPLGSTTVVATATDDAGRVSTCTFDVNLAHLDTTPPVLTCPDPMTLIVCGAGALGPINDYFASATDDCDETLNPQVASDMEGQALALGEHTVNFAVTDASGNSASCNSAITIVLDSDCDGIVDSLDLCDGTSMPESVEDLKKNHWALTGTGPQFDTLDSPSGRSYTLEDTAGCSCEQIVEECGYGKGHLKHGCSNSVMDFWTGKYDQSEEEPFICKPEDDRRRLGRSHN